MDADEPKPEVTPRRRCYPVTPVREAVFLRAVEDGGSDAAAAALAHPGEAPERHGGVMTWRDHAARSPEFALRWAQAKERYLGRLETELSRRVLEGTKRPIFQGQKLMGYETQFSDNLIL